MNNMSINKRIICLANSRKKSGRCIAGKEINGNNIGNWIRPISEREYHEISEYDRRYKDGSTAQTFDIIGIACKAKADHVVQSENYTIDDQYYWEKHGVYDQDTNLLTDSPSTLWENNYSSYNGSNDRIPVDNVMSPMPSLYFVALSNIEIIVRVEGAEFNNAKRKVRVRFQYNGVEHLLSITDPIVEATYLAQGDGSYNISGISYMTVSLGEPWDGFYYKLCAAIFVVK